MRDERMSVEDAFAYCRRIATGHEENFSVVSWLLPKDLRPHMYAVYAYCRGVDDLGDEAEGDRVALLDEWEAELRRCFEGEPSDPRFVALAETVREYGLSMEPFERLVEANRRDQGSVRYENFDLLLDYCTYSANPVGRIVLKMFGYDDDERLALSDETCTALQLANFWQDVAVDAKQGRIYIPHEDMTHYGVSEADVERSHVTEGFRELLRFQVARTRMHFRNGLPLINKVRGRLRLDLKLFSLGGLAVLEAIEDAGYDVLTSRPRIPRPKRAWLALRGLFPMGAGA
jgi:squalene synthase HpnC